MEEGPPENRTCEFPAYGSSLQTKFCLLQNRLSYNKLTSVHLLMAVRVEQHPVGQSVGTAMHPIFQMMVVPACFVRQGTATMRAQPAL